MAAAACRRAQDAEAAHGTSVVALDPHFGNRVTIEKWQQPLSMPAARPPVRQGVSLAPYDAAQANNTVSIDKWLQPFSIPVPVPPTWQGSFFVPFDTVQVEPPPQPEVQQADGGWSPANWKKKKKRKLIRDPKTGELHLSWRRSSSNGRTSRSPTYQGRAEPPPLPPVVVKDGKAIPPEDDDEEAAIFLLLNRF